MAEATGDHGKARESLRSSNETWNSLKHRYNYAQTLLDSSRVMIEPGEGKERSAVIGEAKQVMATLGTGTV
jgi:hypothetical protein